jgi:2-keto-3-deoxy-6-phosphogluconate aldolase
VSVTESARPLAIIRFREACDLDAVIEAMLARGISIVEVTIDAPGALEAVRRAAGAGRVIRVGTVTTVEQVARCADAGARFVVSPGTVVGSYLAAGATCVGVGSEITGRTAPATAAELDRITARAIVAVAGASETGSS